MKIRYLITGMVAVVLALADCSKPDELVRTGSDVNNLVVTGVFPENTGVTYSSVVDFEAGSITIQIPWFMSDTEEIQADLSAMKLSATMPLGAKFEPGLAGIHNMKNGIERSLVYEDGTRQSFVIKAVYVKSNRKQVAKVSFPDAPNTVVGYKEPETADGKSIVTVLLTGNSAFMQSATIAVSPWAYFTTTAPENGDGTYDLSGASPVITVTAQDGSTQKYVVVTGTPEFVPYGQIGYKSALFGFQTTVAEPHGFVAGENRSLAVVGDHLIVGSTSLNFPVLNRFTGELISTEIVNTTGLMSGFVHAITNDDADHLVAITYAANNKTDGGANKIFEVYVWKDGIESTPTRVFTGNITGDSFAAWRAMNNALSNTAVWETGRTVSVRGDITSGSAMLMSFANAMGGSALILRMQFTDGVPANPTGSIKGLYSWGVRSKPIPWGTTGIECPYIMATGNFHRVTTYYPGDAGAITNFAVGNWWTTANIGLGYVEFNGTKLVGVQNVIGTDNPLTAANCRLYVADVTALTTSVMTSGKILDSRLDNYDPNVGPTGPGLNNATLTGMTSNYAVGGTILGPNLENALMNAAVKVGATGDVCFGKSADGNAVQVYMLTTDNGIIAYELTRYDI